MCAVVTPPGIALHAAATAEAERRLDRLVRGRSAPRGSRRGRLVRRALVVADVTGLAVAFLAAEVAYGATVPGDRLTRPQEFLLFLATIPAWLALAKLYKLYDRDDERTDHSTVDDLVGVFHLATVASWTVFAAAWASGAADPGMSKLVTFWALAIVLVTGLRVVARTLCRRSDAYVQNTVVIGAGSVGQLVARKLLQHREYGIRLLGLVDERPRELRADLGSVSVLGAPSELPELVERLDIERVVVAFSEDGHERMLELVADLKALGVQVDIVPRLYEAIGPHTSVHGVEGVPLIALPAPKLFPFSRALKRTVDLVGASIGLVLFAPLFAVFAWRIRRDSPGPVFFRQTRLGEGMKEFEVLKFRTMRVDTDDAEHREFIRATMSAEALPTDNGLYKLERTDAITPVGRFLRRTSLDELPQLINVLRGEMSLVGPRPALAYEIEHFQPHHFERFAVPQGITGLWQVTARAHSTFGEAIEMDVAYARNWSLGLDLMLLLKTPFQVLRQKRGTA
ncbi:MAG TPA: sugar transferase [Gaiellaceae bacterium]|nr:sugar transferase [Gaiellaceae bacterium]